MTSTMKVLSNASNYGLRALLYIVSRERGGDAYISLGEISDELDISFHFLTKTMQLLTQGGILVSYRGPNGGIALKRPAEEIMLIEVVKILEGKDFFDTCMLGLEGCDDCNPCPVHHLWQEIKGKVKHDFATTSLAMMGQRINEQNLRLIP